MIIGIGDHRDRPRPGPSGRAGTAGGWLRPGVPV